MLQFSDETMFFKVAVCFLYMYTLVNEVVLTKCYVCGTEEEEKCENFDPNNRTFIKECLNKPSCGLQTQGNTKIRTCEDLRLNDCQKANDVEYCYCTHDLCNGISLFFTPTDDEDDVEGSGSTPIPTVTLNTSFTAAIPKVAKGNQEMSTPNLILLSLLSFVPPILK